MPSKNIGCFGKEDNLLALGNRRKPANYQNLAIPNNLSTTPVFISPIKVMSTILLYKAAVIVFVPGFNYLETMFYM